MNEVIVSAHGLTYKHKTAAKVGELWICESSKRVVSITGSYNHSLTLLWMHPYSEEEAWGLTDFYSTFKKYEEKQQ